VEHQFATLHRILKRRGVAEISNDDFARQMLEIVTTAGRPDEKAKVGACVSQCLRDVTSDKSTCACDKRFQLSLSVLRLSIPAYRARDYKSHPWRVSPSTFEPTPPNSCRRPYRDR
jgi:hypothetical protein